MLALVAVIIWGTTFASSKALLVNGLTPADIMFYRFALAYALMWAIAPRPLFADSLRDELMFLAAGLCGGSVYFLAENTALIYTQTTNVAIIVATIPLLTALLSRALVRSTRLCNRFVAGSLLSLAGVLLYEMNGDFTFEINMLGDSLAFVAALAWALYNIVVFRLYNTYSTRFITRKVFFYGLATLLPVWIAEGGGRNLAPLAVPTVIWNLLFLGLLASFACYIMWNRAISKIGSMKASNYIYLSPLVAFVTSQLAFDDEAITWASILGGAAILGGVYIAENASHFGRKYK
ncbi:MAG: DMT family transporter [Rikenellaceae bacterium]|jgi:drug/metabolite transporter (DMT)-like permease|nr:DMT family transporter [Rikenellaceae bacterium]